jgi:hypothetical protein
MDAANRDFPGFRRRLTWPLAGIVLIGSAWAILHSGRYWQGHLDLSCFGPCDDVRESLIRDIYVAAFPFPFAVLAILLDLFTIPVCLATIRRGSAWPLHVGVALLGISSLLVHGDGVGISGFCFVLSWPVYISLLVDALSQAVAST